MNASTTGAHGAGAGEPCPLPGPTGSELGLLHEGKTAYADAAVRGRWETQPVRSGWRRRRLQQAYLRAAGRGLSISKVFDPGIYTVIDPPWGMLI